MYSTQKAGNLKTKVELEKLGRKLGIELDRRQKDSRRQNENF